MIIITVLGVFIMTVTFLPAFPLYASDKCNDDQSFCGYSYSEDESEKKPDIFHCIKLNFKALIILFAGFVIFSAEEEMIFFCEALIIAGIVLMLWPVYRWLIFGGSKEQDGENQQNASLVRALSRVKDNGKELSEALKESFSRSICFKKFIYDRKGDSHV